MCPRFTSPPEPTEFDFQVLKMVQQVPPGKVTTYGQIAALLPPPGVDPAAYRAFGARWVGGAMARCPDSVPWQRVVNAQGQISARPGAEKQRQMLEDEGVIFNERGRIDLKRFGWEGPPQA